MPSKWLCRNTSDSFEPQKFAGGRPVSPQRLPSTYLWVNHFRPNMDSFLWGSTYKRINLYTSTYGSCLLSCGTDNTPIWFVGCKAWTLYRRHIVKLSQFQMHCRRKIAHIKWQEHIPNTAVIECCGINSTEAFLQTSMYRARHLYGRFTDPEVDLLLTATEWLTSFWWTTKVL